MKKLSYIHSVISILLLFIATTIYAGESSPINMLQSVSDSMLNGLKQNKATLKKNPAVVYALARRIIVPHADLTQMSKRVLPSQTWNGATQAQRAAFQREFTTTLIRTYASALASYQDQTVKFFPVRGGYQGKSSISVKSEIDSPSRSPVSVTYSLVKSGGAWKLIDMTVEGVSMLQSFRSQFADQLSRGNMSDLLAVLKRHNTGNAGRDAS